jgi:hypothetical protein
MSMPHQPQPRYTEAELVRILRTAAELQDRAGGFETSHTLSLTEIHQIAAEVGIEAAHVEAAAALVSTGAAERWSLWLGTPVRGQLSRVLPGPLPESAWQEVLRQIQGTLKHRGQHSYVPGALEWTHVDAGSEVRVEVGTAADRAHVQITADHRQAVALYLLAAPFIGGGAAVLTTAAAVAGLGVGDPSVIVPAVVSGAGAGLWVGWAALRAMSARWQRRLRSVLEVAAEISLAHRPPPLQEAADARRAMLPQADERLL